MSIPITCSGCKSAFDVPDNLAGKTIRCTSCKAQMSVPDEVPVEAVEEAATNKKAFGSGVRPAAKLPPKPAPAPEAKSSPAKPAAKPVAAKAADDDEEEDSKKPQKKDGKDEKAKPGAKVAGPKKSGITGSTRKRRDDDDDDDDDDAPPRKKKKKPQGGSGGMVAIIAGAAVALVLIVGAVIYLASGSSSKDDTASNTGGASAGTASTTSPTGMSGATTPPAGSGDANPAAPSRPGRPGRPSGLETPAALSDGSSGMNTSGAVTPGTSAPVVITPGAVTPAPGPGGMPPGAGNGFGGAVGAVPQLGTSGEWAPFTGNGFTAEFPGTPGVQTITNAGKVGALTGVISVNQAFLIVSEPIPPADAGQGTDSKLLLATYTDQLSKQVPPFKGKTPTDTTVDGHAAKEFDLSFSGRAAVAKFFVVKDRIFSVAAGKSTSGTNTAQADLTRFFSSIKITYKGDLVAGGPGAVPAMPPGTGMPLMPPGGETPGNTGQPPGGIGQPPIGIGQPPGGIGNPTTGSGDGNKKFKIENFYAGAFDTEKKEFYAIDERAIPGDPRIKKGWLRRYSYSDFNKVLGRYHLPHMASRAVIDPKTERLYAATVNNPLARDARGLPLNPDLHLMDNSSGSGDIAVYDLKLIRDGKTADGKDLKDGMELKPVATISIKAMIHAVELSEDGKALYVLLTSTSTGKRVSSLSVVDTETRKESRTALPTPMRDMVKTGDGKGLIMFEDFAHSRTGSTKVGTFDFTSKSLVNVISVQGGVWDVAPLKDGGALVTVQAPNQPAGLNPGGIGGPPGPIGIGGPGGGGRPGEMGGGLGGGLGAPPGGLGGAGGQPNRLNFRLHLINEKGNTELDLGPVQRFSNAGYAEFDPENKKLYVSSCRGPGLDVFEVTDASAANGLKLTATIQTAGREQVGGHCLVAPDGKMLVFHNGVVIDTANVGGGVAAGAPGFPGGAMPPGGGIAPPGGGVAPGAMPVQGGTGTSPTPQGGTAAPGGTGSPPSGTGTGEMPPGKIPPGGGRPPLAPGGLSPVPDK